jgi:hypothetical protein
MSSSKHHLVMRQRHELAERPNGTLRRPEGAPPHDNPRDRVGDVVSEPQHLPFNPDVARRRSKEIRTRQRALVQQIEKLRAVLTEVTDALDVDGSDPHLVAQARDVLDATSGDPNEGLGSAHKAKDDRTRGKSRKKPPD